MEVMEVEAITAVGIKAEAAITEAAIKGETTGVGTNSHLFILLCMDITHHLWTTMLSNNTTILKDPT